MYLETGLGQLPKGSAKPPPKSPARRPQRAPTISQPRAVPADQLLDASVKWGLKVPFRTDFGAFLQEMAKAIGRHVIKDARDITKVDDWILKRPQNEQRLKAIHDDVKRVKQESDIVIVRTRFNYIRSHIDPQRYSSEVKILGTTL
jgi:hypothetical protein